MGSSRFTMEDVRLAKMVQAEYGVPASIVLAQYALESGYGTSALAQNHNYFGMMGKSQYGSQRRNGRNWQVFPNKEAGFRAYGQLLNKPIYKNKTAGAKDTYDFLNRYIDIYAPPQDGNAGYRQKVRQVIEANNLRAYDDPAKFGQYSGPAPDVSGGGSAPSVDSSKIAAGITKFLFIVLLGIGGFFFLVGGVKNA